MARLVLIVAKSGTGKSSSLRNLTKDEAGVILCSGKELPFKNDLTTFMPKDYQELVSVIKSSKAPIVVIDDVNYMMSFEEMARINETGYGKFTVMAQNLFSVFKAIIDKDSDQTFYVTAHAEERDDDQLKVKTTGKMLSEKIVLEGLTNILITCDIDDGQFVFRVRTDGTGVKTPIGMFDEETVPNDLKIVDKAIRDFYGKQKKEAKK